MNALRGMLVVGLLLGSWATFGGLLSKIEHKSSPAPVQTPAVCQLGTSCK